MKIDNEYATANMDEYRWLKSKNVRYSFVKRDENGITWYKYTKTPKLFETLKNYYINNVYVDVKEIEYEED